MLCCCHLGCHWNDLTYFFPRKDLGHTKSLPPTCEKKKRLWDNNSVLKNHLDSSWLSAWHDQFQVASTFAFFSLSNKPRAISQALLRRFVPAYTTVELVFRQLQTSYYLLTIPHTASYYLILYLQLQKKQKQKSKKLCFYPKKTCLHFDFNLKKSHQSNQTKCLQLLEQPEGLCAQGEHLLQLPNKNPMWVSKWGLICLGLFRSALVLNSVVIFFLEKCTTLGSRVIVLVNHLWWIKTWR